MYVVIYIMSHIGECLVHVCVSGGPVKPSLLGIRLLWVVKVKVGRMTQYYLHMKLYKKILQFRILIIAYYSVLKADTDNANNTKLTADRTHQ